MGFQFAETMAGTVEWDDAPGVRHPFQFDVTAEAASLRDHLRDGQAHLMGVLSAAPHVASAVVEGVITIRPLGRKIIRYELAFIGDDGRPYEMIGQKDIRWLAPIHSFTHLPAEILDEDGHRVATCETTFDLRRDWWSFLRSFRRS